MTRIVFLLAALLIAIPGQTAQLYRWVDDKGRVEWRDTPPPATAKKVERRSVGGSVIETSKLPYSLQQA
ncbi:MAG: glutaredoxin family protein, partial [Proteobacteria bacterium]|nr:glutaredoxin family protein [Pseudomonadota bacterium]